MAISPFNFGPQKTSIASQASNSTDNERLSLSQALTITAGLAGLIGLCSGVIIRFSLAHSPNARFLSPLQTFPALSNWTPETSPESNRDYDLPSNARSQVEPFEALPRTEETSERDVFQDSEGAWVEEAAPQQSAQEPSITSPVDRSTFETFANRREEGSEQNSNDPWKRLEEGPQLGRSPLKGDSEEQLSSDRYDEAYVERQYYEKAYDDPKDEPQYEVPYQEEAYDRKLDTDSRYLDNDTEFYPPEENY